MPVSLCQNSLSSSVPGVPGEDYPVLSSPPSTSFTCRDRRDGGYYADQEAGCQGEESRNKRIVITNTLLQYSTSALQLVFQRTISPCTASSAPTGPSLASSTSSATGGSTSTATGRKTSTSWTTSWRMGGRRPTALPRIGAWTGNCGRYVMVLDLSWSDLSPCDPVSRCPAVRGRKGQRAETGLQEAVQGPPVQLCQHRQEGGREVWGFERWTFSTRDSRDSGKARQSWGPWGSLH